MRKIKFRGKRKDNNKWVYGDLIHEHGQVFIRSYNKNGIQIISVIPETVGQFTGLYDKNGKEIYEGDIIKTKAIVIFIDGKYCLKYLNKFRDWNGMPPLKSNWWEFVEIIGNIYDNSKLLK